MYIFFSVISYNVTLFLITATLYYHSEVILFIYLFVLKEISILFSNTLNWSDSKLLYNVVKLFPFQINTVHQRILKKKNPEN